MEKKDPSAPPSQAPCLIIFQADVHDTGLLGKRFSLEKSPTTLGRLADRDIFLDVDSLSRRHASFSLRDGAWWVSDEGSTHGTLVDGEKISEKKLQDGAVVSVGSVSLRFFETDQDGQINSLGAYLSSIDPLTGAQNRRATQKKLEELFAASRRDKTPLAIALFDIDRFKEFNDAHGHTTGDYALRWLTQKIAEKNRQDDVLCRYGGEEFLLVIPGLDAEQARRYCEAVCAHVAGHPFAHGEQKITMTISAGFAVVSEADAGPTEALMRADEMLLCAKSEGRNCVRGQGGQGQGG